MSKTDFNYPNFGQSNTTLNSFNYNGGGYSLKNISIVSEGKYENIGLFGAINYGSVRDLTIDNMSLSIYDTGDQYLRQIGLIAGSIQYGYLINVLVKNSELTIVSKNYVNYVGAAIGVVRYSNLTKNATSENNTISISPTPGATNHYSNYIGGLFGEMNYQSQPNSLSKFYSKNNTITLSNYGNYVGGLIGGMQNIFSGQTETNNNEYLTLSEFHTDNISITITDNVINSSGGAQSSAYIGGLFGMLNTGSNYTDKSYSELLKSSSTGSITVRRGRYIGGLVGDANARISDVYSKVAINIDLGDYTDWQNASGGSTWYHYTLNNDYQRIGGLIGNLHYRGKSLSNSYSASSIELIGTNFTDALLYEDYTGDGELDQPRRWGALTGDTSNNESEVFVADNVFYDTDLVSLDAVGPSDYTDSNPRLALVNAAGKTTAELKQISNLMKKGWDFVIEISNGTDDIWDINNAVTDTAVNDGYPFFSHEIDNGPLAIMPIILSPSSDFSTGLAVSTRQVIATSAVGGTSTISATSSNSDIVSVAIENTETDGNVTTSDLVFTYNGIEGTTGSALITVTGENPNAETGEIEFSYFQDQNAPVIESIRFYNGTQMRLGGKTGENIRIEVLLSESAGESNTIGLTGWGPDVTADMSLDSENDKKLYYNFSIPEDATQTEAKVTVSINASDVSNNLSTGVGNFVVADVRQPEGQGNEFNPYEVSSVANLSWVFDSHPSNIGANFEQTQDLDLQGYNWMSKTDFNYPNFGQSNTTLNSFNYNGGGYSLKNISIVSEGKYENIGLFGAINYGSVRDLTIDNMSLSIYDTGDQYLRQIGLIAGSIQYGYLINVLVKNSELTIVSKNYVNYVGAAIGVVRYSNLTKNATSENNTISISPTPGATNHYSNYIGGLFGEMNYQSQPNSLSKFYSKNNTITLSNYGNYVGGLIGGMQNIFSGQTETNNNEYLTLSEFHTDNISITITDNVINSSGGAQSSAYIGGLFGMLNTGSNYTDKSYSELLKSSSTGSITVRRGRYIGGLVGDANARISDVYSKVAINIDLGDYTDWQNASGGSTWYHYTLNNDYQRIGGLIGNLHYRGKSLSNSYSASSIELIGTNFTDALLYEDYTGDGELDQPRRWGALTGDTSNNESEVFVADNVFYDTDLVSLDAVGPSDYTDSNPRLALVNAAGKTTAELKQISNLMKKGWDFVIEISNGTDDIWDINNAVTDTAVNDGYPFFSHEIDNGPLAIMPIILSPSSDFSTGLAVSTRQVIATSAVGGTSTISATSSNSDIVSVAIENTETDGNVTTSDLVFTYNGIEGTTGSALITVTGENPNAETGEMEFSYIQDKEAPMIESIRFYNGTQMRLGGKTGENIRIEVLLSESAGESNTIGLTGWGPDVTADMSLDSENDKKLYYNFSIPEDATQTEAKVTVSINASDVSNNLSTGVGNFVVADVRQPEGQGNEFNPYEVSSVANLSWVFDSHPSNIGANFEQTQDLDLQGYNWMSKTDFNYPNFGQSSTTLNSFNYNGGGYSLKNISIVSEGKYENIGLFGAINYGSVRDLTIDNMSLSIYDTGDQYLRQIGLIAGSIQYGYLINVLVKNSELTIVSKNYVNYVGAAIGVVRYSNFTENATSENNTISISPTPGATNHYSNYIGGLFGEMNYQSQPNSLSKFYSKNNTITLSNYGNYVGGLIGGMQNIFSGQTETNNNEYLTLSEFHTDNISITITDNVINSSGGAQSSAYIGGLFGMLNTGSNYTDKSYSELLKSSSTGSITVRRGRYIGGLVGDANARISDVYSKVAINIDLGDYTDWQNASGGSTWYHYTLNNDYQRIGGLIGNLHYRGKSLSNSYSASSIELIGTNFTDALLYEDYTGDGELDQPRRWGALTGDTSNNESEVFVADNVFYDTDLVSLDAVGPSDYTDSNPRLALVNAVGKTTTEMTVSTIYEAALWDISTNISSSTIWGINAELNGGYPYFNDIIDSYFVPIITLIGDANVYLLLDETYTEEGATAVDYTGVDITADIVTDNTNVITYVEGVYNVTYNVTDSAGNVAEQVIRRVYVKPASFYKPVINLLGSNPLQLDINVDFNDPGAIATNYLGAYISDAIVVTGTLDTTTVGTYALYYNVTDAEGNIADQVIRTVSVVDNTVYVRPEITLVGAAEVYLLVDTDYVEENATAEDSEGVDLTSAIVINATNVDTSVEGDYTVTYDVTDLNGTEAIQVERMVYVRPQAFFIPNLILNGDAEMTLEIDAEYEELGAVATDYLGNDISGSIVLTGSVVTSIEDVYSLYYNVTDTEGNAAIQVSRTITVLAAVPPTITLLGEPTETYYVGDSYVEAGATAVDAEGVDLTTAIVIDASNVVMSDEGDYEVTYNVLDSNGTAAIEVVRTVTVIPTLGLDDLSKMENVKLYPNPTFDMVYVKIDNLKRLEVYDINSRKLFESTERQISLSSYQTGVYFVKVINNKNNSRMFKIVLK